MSISPHTPKRERPAVSGVILKDAVYTLAELRQRLRWQEHAVRQARMAGLRIRRFGRSAYVLGSDVLDFFGRLGDDLATEDEP